MSITWQINFSFYFKICHGWKEYQNVSRPMVVKERVGLWGSKGTLNSIIMGHQWHHVLKVVSHYFIWSDHNPIEIGRTGISHILQMRKQIQKCWLVHILFRVNNAGITLSLYRSQLSLNLSNLNYTNKIFSIVLEINLFLSCH